MNTSNKIKTGQSSSTLRTYFAHNLKCFPPIEEVTSTTVSTNAAGYYLNRKDQTMRSWACLENGPILPIRINGRLGWRVSDIKTLLGEG